MEELKPKETVTRESKANFVRNILKDMQDDTLIIVKYNFRGF